MTGKKRSKQIPTWFFAAVVIRDADRFVLVHETGPEDVWGLPGGRLESGETFTEAARRETMEEAGIEIAIEGILGFEHTPIAGRGSRVGVALQGRMEDGQTLKTEPDRESRGAAWFGLSDLEQLPLRGPRVARLVRLAFSEPGLIPLDRIEDLRSAP